MALRAPVSPCFMVVSPERAASSQRVAFALQVLLAARSGSPHSVALPLGAPRKPGSPSRHSWLHGYLLLLAPLRPRL